MEPKNYGELLVIAERLAEAVQRLRHTEALKSATSVLETMAFGNVCNAWYDWREAGGKVLTLEEVTRVRSD